MPQADGERIATNEQAIRDMRSDLADLKAGEERTRRRLHELEASVKGLVIMQQEERRVADLRNRKIIVWLQALALAVGVGGLLMSAALIAVAIVYH